MSEKKEARDYVILAEIRGAPSEVSSALSRGDRYLREGFSDAFETQKVRATAFRVTRPSDFSKPFRGHEDRVVTREYLLLAHVEGVPSKVCRALLDGKKHVVDGIENALSNFGVDAKVIRVSTPCGDAR